MGLSNTMYTGVSGLNTFGTALSIVSDNVANANSTGYKSNSGLFGDLVSGYMATQSVDTESQGAGSNLLGVATDFSTGPTLTTGTWSNVMIQGNGFFSVQDNNAVTGYTRDGSFRVDSSGFLSNMQGDKVLGTDGKPIQIEADPTNPTYTSYNIEKGTGNIYGTLPGGTTTTLIGTLRVSTFPNQEGLIRNGNNLYYPGASAGAPIDSTGGVGQAGQIVAGAIEGSNVDLGKEMVNMIIFQSDYTANSKSIETANNMLTTVVNMIR
jgi:flagellar hook protein FlgE